MTRKVATRFQYAQALAPDVHARHVVVPLPVHETKAVGRIGDDAVHRMVRQVAEDVEAVAKMDGARHY